MKTLTASFFALAVSSFAANAADSVWVARLSGNIQCEAEQPSTLGQAVSDLEQRGINVQEAKVGMMPDRFFCSACGCPDGTFNFAKVELTEAVEEAVKEGDWEMAKPKTGHGDFRILPVNPPVVTE